MAFVLHTFRPFETIDAVIRLLGRHNLSPAEMVPLRAEYDRLNPTVVPKPGTTVKIPLPEPEQLQPEIEVVEQKEQSAQPDSVRQEVPSIAKSIEEPALSVKEEVANIVHSEQLTVNEAKVEDTKPSETAEQKTDDQPKQSLKVSVHTRSNKWAKKP